MRDAIERAKVYHPDIGNLYLTGMGAEQLDASHDTFKSLPKVVAATLGVVGAILMVAFRSVLIPLRAVVCLLWIFIVTFGSAVFVYQDGALEWTNISGFKQSCGALFWISPTISFNMVCGLGLDYDIFFMESVVEHHDHGLDGSRAVIGALRHTGSIVAVAGVIMLIAFTALLFCSTPVLNQVAFVMSVGVILACFVSTKIIVPAVMCLVPSSANFWPRKQPTQLQEHLGEPNSATTPDSKE